MVSKSNWIIKCLLVVILACLPAVIFAGGEPTVEVEMLKFKFIPEEITVKVGDSVRWTNKEKRQYHSVWFEEAGDPEPDYIFPDETYQRTFDKPGDYPYHCVPHPKMTGVVNVED